MSEPVTPKPAAPKAPAKAKRAFLVQLRHVPFATKKATVQATDADDAWEQFVALAKQGKGEKKYKEADVKAAEGWLAEHGKEHATITEV